MERIDKRLELEKSRYQQSHKQLQQLCQAGVAAVVEAQDRHCQYCGVQLVPEIRTFDAPWTEAGTLMRPVYPVCGCDESKQAERTDAAYREKRERETRASAFRLRLHNAGLVGWLADATFESFEGRKDWKGAAPLCVQVRRFVDAVLTDSVGERPWLILYGRYGTGKTHLAAAAIHNAIEGGLPDCHFRSWTDYLKRLQASWQRENGEARTSDIVDELQRGRLIAIDDLDKRRDPSGWAREELYTVLNHRYNAKRPTIITFNYDPKTPDPDAPGRLMLERFMSRAILDRVIGAKWAALNFDGPSYRSGVKWETV